MTIKIQTLHALATVPKYKTNGSAGMDLCACINDDIILEKNEFKLIPTGIAISLPDQHEAQIRPRSGLALKHGITVLNSPGTIDSDYRGEIKILLINQGNQCFTVTNEMRIAQMVISKYEKIEWSIVKDLDSETTARGEGGFGSTGM